MQKQLAKVIKSISLRYNVPEAIVEKAVLSQFQCARNEVMKGSNFDIDTFKNVRFKYIGLLYVKPWKLKKLKEAYERSADNDSNKDNV